MKRMRTLGAAAAATAFSLTVAAQAHAQSGDPTAPSAPEPPQPPPEETPVARPAPPAEPTPAETPPQEILVPAAPPFGAKGQVVLSGNLGFSAATTSYAHSGAEYKYISIDPSADYFVVRNVSIGLSLDFSTSEGKGYGSDGSLVRTTVTTLSAGAQLGYNLQITRWLSFYPRLTLGVESQHRALALESGQSLSVAGSPTGSSSTTLVGPWIDVNAKLLFHPAPHFFVGVGPQFFQELGRSQDRSKSNVDAGGQRTELGAGVVVGGYFGGAPLPEDVAPRHPRRLFGERHTLVLSNDISASAYGVSYADTDSSSLNVSFAPSADFFVAENVSLGVAVPCGYGDTKGKDALNGATVESKVTSYGVAGRFGVNWRIAGDWLSLYPRASLTVSAGERRETSGQTSNSPSFSAVSVGLFAPMLVHPAEHFFVGLGPTVDADISRTYKYGSQTEDVPGTSIGASATLGGWL